MTVLILPGDAGFADVLAGKKFDAGILYNAVGTMVDRGTVSTDITTKAQQVTIAAGKHSGSGVVQISAAEQAKVIAANIKSGITLLGQAGATNVVDTTEGSVPVSAGLILSGYKSYVNGALVTGSMLNKGGQGFDLGYSKGVAGAPANYLQIYVPYNGYYDTNSYLQTNDGNLLAGNIKSGVSIFGVAGSLVAAVPAIQSVQRGLTAVPTGTSNLTINSVNMNATIVKYMDLYTPNSSPWSIQLTSATNLQFIQNQGSTQTMSWEAIEFNSALVRGVQRGSFVFAYTPNPFTVAISSINPAKAMLIISSGKYTSGALGYILNATTIAFASFNSGVTIFWQVIEFN